MSSQGHAGAGGANQLPPGWMAIQDPASGMTYYANQTTGETTWERPAPVAPLRAAPAPSQPGNSNPSNGSHFGNHHPTTTPSPQQQQQVPSQSMTTAGQPKQTIPAGMANGTNSGGGAKLMSKYGDGFVTSASHPELAQQYGNVGTSNSYMGVQRPGTAKTPVRQANAAATVTAAPSSGQFDPANPPPLSLELQPLADTFLHYASSLSSSTATSSPSEQKQIAEISKSVGVLIKKLSKGQVDAAVVDKLRVIVAALQGKDYGSAGAAQTSLVNSDWREHKDWLKGMKFLIQLGSRRGI
mmetsp:Transcript_62957/g.74463  ORF Transcript_62957/g.74463 Transcript_62957/m.74463 type:complete len:298 (+) Transcript_62957:571-1464(+)